MQALKKMLVRMLKDTANKIETGTCEMTETEAMDIMKVLAHESLSKEQACNYLNMSRSKFDAMVAEGKLPKGKKIAGWRELRWYKDELKY